MSVRMQAARSFVLDGKTINAFTIFTARSNDEADAIERDGLARRVRRQPGPTEPAPELPVVTRAGRETNVELEPDQDAVPEPKRSSRPGPKETRPEAGPAELKG